MSAFAPPHRLALLLDGEYVKKILVRQLGRFPSHEDVLDEVSRIVSHPDFVGLLLYRVYFYTAEPLAGRAVHPLSGEAIAFDRTVVYERNKRLIDQLEHQPDIAVRRGTLAHQGWELGRAALKTLMGGRRSSVEARDLVPVIQQKGVDMRIGLDLASLALKRLVSTVVLVSGDSDLVPAMKLARREGLRVYLDPLGQTHIRSELVRHADRVIDRRKRPACPPIMRR